MQTAAVERFEAMYRGAGRDEQAIPWQDPQARPLAERWLASFDPTGHERALVVAAGLGDHAAALDRLGLSVVAFDAAPTAVAWARERHPETGVRWEVADLFAPPRAWLGGFDLVLEVFTVQAIDPARHEAAARTVAGFVAPGGLLVVVAMVGPPGDGRTLGDGPPWPLDPAVLDAFGAGGPVGAPVDERDLGDGLREVRLEVVRSGGAGAGAQPS